MEEIFFDLGANKGQNLSYYLSHASRVVAVEANTKLANQIASDFASKIEEGRLQVVNRCLSVDRSDEIVDFYIHQFDSGLSRFTPPKKITLNTQQQKYKR